MTKTDGRELILGLIVASLSLFTSPSSSQGTTEGEQGKIIACQGSEGSGSSISSSDDWDFRYGSGYDPDGRWTYSRGEGSGPDGSTTRYGSGVGLSPDGSWFGYGWGSSRSGDDKGGSPSYGGGSGYSTGPGIGNGCGCSEGSNDYDPPESGSVAQGPESSKAWQDETYANVLLQFELIEVTGTTKSSWARLLIRPMTTS
ncbi:hypothetical protein PTKIN_Ptkin09bG0184000 [Pterospermum kingtungense]